MLIHVRHLRRNYWTARFASFPNPQHVGEGRTKAEAIGALMVIAAERNDMHGGPVVTELPKSEFSGLKMGFREAADNASG